MLTKCIIILPSSLLGAEICMVTAKISLSSSDGLTLGHENNRAESVTSNTDDQAAVVAFEAFRDSSQKKQQGCQDMSQGIRNRWKCEF